MLFLLCVVHHGGGFERFGEEIRGEDTSFLLVDRSFDWPIACLLDCLIDCLLDWFIDWSIAWLVARSIDWVNYTDCWIYRKSFSRWTTRWCLEPSVKLTDPRSYIKRPSLSAICRSRHLKDYANLLADRAGSDFTLVSADGLEFPVHCSILSTRSPMWAAMLVHAMREKGGGRCEVGDGRRSHHGSAASLYLHRVNWATAADGGDTVCRGGQVRAVGPEEGLHRLIRGQHWRGQFSASSDPRGSAQCRRTQVGSAEVSEEEAQCEGVHQDWWRQGAPPAQRGFAGWGPRVLLRPLRNCLRDLIHWNS